MNWREREVREKKYAQVLEVEFGGDEDDERHEYGKETEENPRSHDQFPRLDSLFHG